MRLFIAIDFNELNDYFIGLQKELPANVKLNLTKTFHLTLKFLGEVQPNNVEGIADILKNIKFENFFVHLDSIGIFPSENCIRTVWVGLKPEDKILELQKNIDIKLKDLFDKEKNFKAHITLARAKFIEDRKSFIDNLKKIKVEDKKIDVNNFKLVKSALTPEGPVYEDLTIFNSG